MKYAFTATRTLTPEEEAYIERVLRDLLRPGDTVITGACLGGDAKIARVAFSIPGVWVKTIVPAVPLNHRFLDQEWQKYCHESVLMPPGIEPYRERNTVVVAEGDELIAFPKSPWKPGMRSGTWMTVHIAERARKPVTVHLLIPL